MTDPSKPLANARHEAFAVQYALEKNAAKAWIEATEGDGKHADANGSKWLKNGSIAARVEWLKAEAEKRALAKLEKQNSIAVLSIERKRSILSSIAEGGQKDADRIAAIKADNDLAPEVEKQGIVFNIHIGES